MDEGVVPAESKRRAGVFGALVGLAAAGVAVGVAAERAIVTRARRARRTPADPYADEPFGRLSYDEAFTLPVDGIDLHVEVVEAVDGIELDPDFAAAALAGAAAPSAPTVVFVHGFCLASGAFHFQRKELTRRGAWRSVYYDQPGHGRSGKLAAGEYELPALGDALRAVIEATTPEGPVVLVGHSMGGMTVMALAEGHPEFFAERVVGVVLISTSAGLFKDGERSLPALLARVSQPLLPLVNGATKVTGRMIDHARQAAGNLAWLLTRRYGFGSDNPSPAMVSYVERMNSATQTETVARYVRTLYQHARHPVLEALRETPVLLICGDCDPITPLTSTEDMKRLLPDAELVVIPKGGHMVLMERAEAVNEVLVEFLEKLS